MNISSHAYAVALIFLPAAVLACTSVKEGKVCDSNSGDCQLLNNFPRAELLPPWGRSKGTICCSKLHDQLVGQTLMVQNFRKWTKRDWDAIRLLLFARSALLAASRILVIAYWSSSANQNAALTTDHNCWSLLRIILSDNEFSPFVCMLWALPRT